MHRPVCVYGAGALGSLLGALLSKRAEVTLVGRKAHVEQIHHQGGLRITASRPGLYSLRAITKSEGIPARGIVLVTVKAFDLEEALARLAPGIDSSHLVVVLQNGLGIRTLAERVLGRPVVRAVTFMAASLEEPGHVAFNAVGKTYFPAHEELLQLWRACDMPAVQVEDIETYVWRKLAINAVINPLSALLDVSNGQLLELRDIARELVEELVLVAQREGQHLETEETLAKVLASMKQTARNTSSMLQDVRAGRRTEIEWINGVVVKLAQVHGIAVPRHQQILDLVRFVAGRRGAQPVPVRATT